MTTRRLSATASLPPEWTKLVDARHPTGKIGSRFRFRKLFLRQLEFSLDELEFIVEYLEHETTLSSQEWWMALSRHERNEVAAKMKLYSVRKDEEQIIWLSSIEATKSCILIHGTAEARPIDRALAPVLRFTEGAVVGNLVLPSRLGTAVDEREETSTVKWRSLKREKTLRSTAHHYSKLVIHGPADYLMLKSTDVIETISGVADRVERDSWAKAFGLECFAGSLRCMSFEPGTCLAVEGQQSDALYLIVQGECRASVQQHQPSQNPICSSTSSKAMTTAMEYLLHEHTFELSENELPIASLGPKSSVGEISLMLGVPEPATVRAVTTVNVLALSRVDFMRESGAERADLHTLTVSIEKLRVVAYDTLRFVLGRIEFEAKQEQSDHAVTVDALRGVLSQHEQAYNTALQTLSSATTRQKATLSEQLRASADTRQPTSATSPLPSIVQGYMQRPQSLPTLAPVGDSLLLDGFVQDKLGKQQRKAAREFSNLLSPVASKSMGDSNIGFQRRANEAQANCPATEAVCRSDELFLVPTMTRQRQLHGKYVFVRSKYDEMRTAHW